MPDRSRFWGILKGRAIAYCADGEITNAITDCRSYNKIIQDLVEKEGMTSLRSDLEQSLLFLGIVLTIDNKVDQAEPYLEQAIKLNTDHKFTKIANLLVEYQKRPDASQIPKILLNVIEKKSPWIRCCSLPGAR